MTVDLDQLEALAKAASERDRIGREIEDWMREKGDRGELVQAGQSPQWQAYKVACATANAGQISPDVVLKLIAVARAAKAYLDGPPAGIDDDERWALRLALDALYVSRPST